jgi:hypothetical protein
MSRGFGERSRPDQANKRTSKRLLGIARLGTETQLRISSSGSFPWGDVELAVFVQSVDHPSEWMKAGKSLNFKQGTFSEVRAVILEAEAALFKLNRSRL